MLQTLCCVPVADVGLMVEVLSHTTQSEDLLAQWRQVRQQQEQERKYGPVHVDQMMQMRNVESLLGAVYRPLPVVEVNKFCYYRSI